MTRLTQATLLLAAFPLLAPSTLSADSPEIAPGVTAQPASTHSAATAEAAGLFGRVQGGVEPLSAVRVYAYQLADFSLKRVITGEDGAFRFPELPAGLYKIIAHKAGFVPSVVMLSRPRTDARQFVELELAEQAVEGRARDDFWSVRDRIPADVLRELVGPQAGVRLADSPFDPSERVVVDRLGTGMEALTGVDRLPTVGEALVSGGQVGFEGMMGDLRVGLSGDYWRLGPAGRGGRADRADPEIDGLAREIALEVEGEESSIVVSTVTQRMTTAGDEPIDYEAHRLSWDTELEGSRAHVGAKYSSQANYYADAVFAPAEIPRDSSAWELDGSYTIEADQRSSFQAGMRYRDRRVGVAGGESLTDTEALRDERLDLFGRAGTRLRPTVLIEYGLYTTLRDGSLSLIPRGGLVLQLGDAWRASALASGKLDSDGHEGPRDFVPAFYRESSDCTQGEQSCYKLSVSRQDADGESDLSIGAVHREIGETLRLFFNDDFFNHVESLYLVRGDEIPELQFGISRRVTPEILARLESSMGSGGGGVFYATDNERYENSVRYLVTSLDTRFQGTQTGLFVSFHHLEQELELLGSPGNQDGAQRAENRLELQRLQLMLTQDLNILLDLAADWAVKLDMELSRGSVLFGPEGEGLRRRVLGGFAVRF